MEVKIMNKARHLVIVPLNSGKTVHLMPGESSEPIDTLETRGNERIKKLINGNLLEELKTEEKTHDKSKKGKK